MLREPLPFRPTAEQRDKMPLFQENKVPRYLFRVHTPNSAGHTTTSCVIPSASTCGSEGNTADIFSLDPENAANLLNAHLWWWGWHENNCNLMSWTGSLLSALGYALHRHRGSRDPSELADVSLLVLDTRGFPEGTFVSELEILSVFAEYERPFDGQKQTLYNLRSIRREQKYWYFGEYLTQGDLDIQGRCTQTSLQRIYDLGLFDILPELDNNEKRWKKWASGLVALRSLREFWPNAHREAQPAPPPVVQLPGGVLRIRNQIVHNTRPDARPATHLEVRKAITMADVCFGGDWTVPLAAMLLALRPRKSNDAVIVQGFAAMFSRDEIERLSLGDIELYDLVKMPEVKEFQMVINDIHQYFINERAQVNATRENPSIDSPVATAANVGSDDLTRRFAELDL